MASPPAISLLLLLFFSASSSASAACSTKSFSNNRSFASCADLSTLGASLHWTYNRANATLSLAFSAPPSKSAGWISWGINPAKPAMIGTRALLAYKLPNGSVTAQTFNITSYNNIKPSPIEYAVSGLAAQSHSGGFVIFATLGLPKGTTTVNQVWQVGPGVSGSIPDKHGFAAENLQAMGMLDLLKFSSSSPAPSPSDSPTPITPPSSTASPTTSQKSTPSSACKAASCWPVMLLAVLGLLLSHHVLH